jgi:molybdopterin-guanine dinucleotide biosynthesis protein A
VVNVNGHADYALAIRRPAPLITVQCFDVAAAEHGHGRRTVRATTIGAAAAAAGVTWGRHVLALLNGDHVGADVDLPLVSGAAVAFLSTVGSG